jgi:hypothetical protein
MAERTVWETLKAEGGAVVDRLKELIREGNIRRVRIRQGQQIIAEFPLTAGVVGAVIAPALAGIAAIVALVKDCTIEIERERRTDSDSGAPAA